MDEGRNASVWNVRNAAGSNPAPLSTNDERGGQKTAHSMRQLLKDRAKAGESVDVTMTC